MNFATFTTMEKFWQNSQDNTMRREHDEQNIKPHPGEGWDD